MWVVPKSRVEVWESLNCPPTKWGYCPASHENPGTGENTPRSGKMIVVVVVVVVDVAVAVVVVVVVVVVVAAAAVVVAVVVVLLLRGPCGQTFGEWPWRLVGRLGERYHQAKGPGRAKKGPGRAKTRRAMIPSPILPIPSLYP